MKKRIFWWTGLVVLFVVNLWILINRKNGYKYYPYKTYNQLYVTDSTLYITGIRFDKNLLLVRFSLPLTSRNWKLYTDESFTVNINAHQKDLTFPLKNGFHHYKLIAEKGIKFPVLLAIDHTSHADGSYDNDFIHCNLPGPDEDLAPIALSTWRVHLNSFSNDERTQGYRLLTDSIHILKDDDDVTKTLKIGLYLRHLNINLKGIDPAEVATKSAWEQIKLSQQGKANLNCGNYAAMFYFLGGLAGLVTRGIVFSGPDGNWHYGSHYMNEVYLHEVQQWSVVDNLNNIYLPHDSIRFYNAADVKKMADVNGFANKFCYDLNNDSIKTVTYNKVNYYHYYYNQSDADLTFLHSTSYKYSWFNNLWQFYIPVRDRDFYSDKKTNNTGKLIVKTIFILAFILLLFIYVAWELRHDKKKYISHT